LITSNNSSITTSAPTVNDLGVSDHFVVLSALNISWNQPSIVKFQRCNLKSLNVSEFLSELLASSICLCPKSTTNEFAVQLRDDVTTILDKLVPLKHVTKRHSSHTSSWLFKEAVDTRCKRRQMERYC
jgi:hypothetical protein